MSRDMKGGLGTPKDNPAMTTSADIEKWAKSVPKRYGGIDGTMELPSTPQEISEHVNLMGWLKRRENAKARGSEFNEPMPGTAAADKKPDDGAWKGVSSAVGGGGADVPEALREPVEALQKFVTQLQEFDTQLRAIQGTEVSGKGASEKRISPDKIEDLATAKSDLAYAELKFKQFDEANSKTDIKSFNAVQRGTYVKNRNKKAKDVAALKERVSVLKKRIAELTKDSEMVRARMMQTRSRILNATVAN